MNHQGRYFRYSTFIFLLAFSITNLLTAGVDTLYVTQDKVQPNGEDTFSNIQEAIDFAAGRIQSGNVSICIREGFYPLSASLRLPVTRGDYKLTIEAAEGESVTLFGGSIIESSWFEPVGDRHFLDQLVNKDVKDKLVVADLFAQGIREFGEIKPHGWAKEPEDRVPPAILIVGGKRMTLARWPNKNEASPYLVYEHYLPEKRPLRGYEVRMQEIIDDITIKGHVGLVSVVDPGDNYDPGDHPRAAGGTFKVAFDRMKYWHNIEIVFLDGVLGSTWEWTYNQLLSADVKDKTITLAEPELHGIGRGSSVRLPHFYFENIPEEIDVEGEYYLDRNKGLLYFYPSSGSLNEPIILTTLNDPMVVARNARSVAFKNLIFDCGRNLAFQIDQCEDIVIEGCTIANFTLGGIKLSGSNCLIDNCHIYGIGAFGIAIEGGDLSTLKKGNNLVTNCIIHDFGWDQKSQMPGIMVDGVGHRIEHCNIYDGTHFGIRLRQINDVVLEYNKIHDLPTYHYFDGGALYHYSGPSPEMLGNVIRYNHFYDVPTIGIYPDNYTWGDSIYGNVFERVGVFANRPAINVNGGGDVQAFNNIMINCPLLYVQGRHPSSLGMRKDWENTIAEFGGGYLEYTPHRKYDSFRKWLVNTELSDWLDGKEETEPDKPFRARSYVHNNLFYNPDIAIYKDGDHNAIKDNTGILEVKNNWITHDDPGFVDFESGNFNLKKDAEVFSKIKGFKPVPFEKIGRKEADPFKPKPQVYFVSSSKGSDEHPGTLKQPFRSLQYAVLQLQPGDTCFIREGIYREEVLLSGLKGNEELPVVIAAYSGEDVVLDGTMDISGSWEIHGSGIYKTVLEEDIWQLFVDGKMMTSARWPDAEAWSEEMWALEKTWIHQSDEGSYGRFIDNGTLDLAGSGFDFTGAIAVMNVGSWETFAGKVLEHGAGNPAFFYEKTFPESSFRKPWEGRAFFECSMVCMDQPGEWYYEPGSRTLYLIPPDGQKPGEDRIRGKVLSYVLDVEECSYLELRGINFFASTGRFLECDHLLLEDCNFKFPSYSKRMLGSTAKPEATTIFSSGGEISSNRIINCSFSYADGSGLMLGGVNDVVENCSFNSIDYGCVGTVNDVFINARDAAGLTFRYNTMIKTGNSVGLKTGARSLVEMNFATRLGLLQHDGSALQASTENVEGTVMRRNWVFNSAKSGIRFDSPWLVPDVYGIGGTINRNVIWNTRRIQPKGDHHFVYHNTSFDNEQSDLSIFSDLAHGGVNEHTITRNNAVNILSGSNSGPHTPIRGIHDHNWVGMDIDSDVKDELRDPANFDFRPGPGSSLIDQGVRVEGVNDDFKGEAPDIGAYEYGVREYWMPGRRQEKASFPVPVDGGETVKEGLCLMWRPAYKADSYHVYLGTSAEAVDQAGLGSKEYQDKQNNNVFDPGDLAPDSTYYWRVDAVRDSIIIKGETWHFVIGSEINVLTSSTEKNTR